MNKYLYKASGQPDKQITFQANLAEIKFELLNDMTGGYYLRLEL